MGGVCSQIHAIDEDVARQQRRNGGNGVLRATGYTTRTHCTCAVIHHCVVRRMQSFLAGMKWLRQRASCASCMRAQARGRVRHGLYREQRAGSQANPALPVNI